MVPLGSHSPFAPIAPDLDPSYCRVTPPTHRKPHGLQEDALALFWQLLPATNSPGVESGQVVRRIMREAERCELVVSTFL